MLYILILTQIILESIPVSSSGHIALLSYFLHWHTTSNAESIKYIYYFLHAPALIITLIFFYRYWYPLVQEIFFKKTIFTRPFLFFFILELATLFLFIILAPVHISLTFGFCLTGILLLCLHFMPSAIQSNNWRWSHAVIMGIAQAAALIPGISRLGATYCSARWLKYRPHDALAIACLAATPIDCVGFIIGFTHIYHTPTALVFNLNTIGVGILTTIISYAALYGTWILAVKDRLWWLSWYMLLPISLSLFVK